MVVNIEKIITKVKGKNLKIEFMIIRNSNVMIKLPINPSYDLFGEIFGRILCFPKFLPTK